MTRVRIPANLGECEIIIAKGGNYAVWNRKSGKNKLMIPCRDRSHTEDVLRRLREGDHDGQLWV